MIKVWRYWIVRPRVPLLAAQFTLVSAVLLHFAVTHQAFYSGTLPQNLGLILLFVLPQLSLYLGRFQAAMVGDNYARFLTEVLAALGIGLIVAVVVFWAAPSLFPGPATSLAVVAATTVALLAFRPFLRWLFRHRRFVEGLLVLGSGEMASKFYRELVNGKDHPRRPDHIPCRAPVARGALSTADPDGSDVGVAVTFEQLREIALRDGISRIVVAEPNVYRSQALAVALLDCKLRGLEVEQAVESYEKFAGKMWLEGMRPDWLVYSEGFRPPKYYLQVKRLLDTVSAFLLLIVTGPLFLLTALAIKVDSKGPVLFRQERVGWHGKPFTLYKFRTMREDAEQRSGPVWAGEEDPRVTRLGRLLRKFRIDELPQLWNVLRGEMSLVGPRPERPHFVKLLNDCVPYYALRHSVKPGVTGWAQVLYHYGASIEDAYEKLQYDLYYAKHMSLGFDMLIFLNTARVVLFGRGR